MQEFETTTAAMLGGVFVIGLVLAAGCGKRLMPHTKSLPKTLMPVRDDLTLLDIVLCNLATVDVSQVVLVVGHASEVIEERLPTLSKRYGVQLRTITNDRYELNNAYSLWLAKEELTQTTLLVNGDTLHSVAVEEALLAQRRPGLLLAVDSLRELTAEAMKVQLHGQRVVQINKAMTPETASGEYIGVALIEQWILPDLVDALEHTWRRNPQLYYEDAFQLLVGGGDVWAADIGQAEWVEVDDHSDLVRAREIACRY